MNLTLSRKIALAFGLFVALVTTVVIFARKTLNEGREINEQITEVYTPSLQEIKDLDVLITHSKYLILYWTYVQSRDDDPQKTELRRVIAKELPSQMAVIDSLSTRWPEEEVNIKQRVANNLAHLIVGYETIMNDLSSFDSYNDPMLLITSEQAFGTGRMIPQTYDQIKQDLEDLSYRLNKLLNEATEIETQSFSNFYTNSKWFAIATGLAGIFIAFILIRTIVGPVNLVRKTLLYMGKGIYPKKPIRVGGDEIGEMAFAVNRLVDGLRKTKEFSTNVGEGNFEASYHPLSDEDELGYALLKMRDDLAANERLLEHKVEERTNEVVRQKEEIEKQKERVTELYTDLTDSINYAKRLQQSILPTDQEVRAMFNEHFILFRPRNIVSGDFYWFKNSGNKKIFAAVDCTGHGVPGAFMSLVGNNVLNTVTKVFTRPDQVLNNLNRIATEMLHNQDSNTKDGMDIAICTLDTESMQLEFSGANNPLWIVRNGELIQQRGDKVAIGSFDYATPPYTNHVFDLEKGDCIYLFSDGFPDQFGGPKGKKFLRKRFRELILENSTVHMHEQKEKLNAAFIEWKGSEEQVDDILVIGIRV
ncbi:MAG: SpoIIE family protein phosphatase [Flavobacteriales bacterium]|nr:SpoIIE family protein phosphatase [Flavobacteriales bacterium]